jgi:hypothetical protein
VAGGAVIKVKVAPRFLTFDRFTSGDERHEGKK